MKYLLIALISLGLALGSCGGSDKTQPIVIEEPQIEESSICIVNTIVPASQHSIKQADIQTANDLFSRNHINTNNYRYYQYLHDTMKAPYDRSINIYTQEVKLQEYTNGLRIFTSYLYFFFYDGIFHEMTGKKTKGTSLDTKPNLTVEQLHKSLFEVLKQNRSVDRTDRDSCFSAEFGYYNIDIVKGSVPENLIKAWKVTLKSKKNYLDCPVAYFRDDNGKLIYYDDGIRTID